MPYCEHFLKMSIVILSKLTGMNFKTTYAEYVCTSNVFLYELGEYESWVSIVEKLPYGTHPFKIFYTLKV